MPAPAKAGKGIDLEIVFGLGGKGGRKKPPGPAASEETAEDPMMGESDEEAIDPAFEAAAVEYDPSLEGDTARLGAFKRAIMACMDSY